ncbi:hypothetical protein ACOMHN_044300 [Nucella lapillus]
MASGDSSSRRHGTTRVGRDVRDCSLKRGGQNSARHTESGNLQDSRSRHTERRTHDSYRTGQSQDRKWALEEPSRRRAPREDRRLERSRQLR